MEQTIWRRLGSENIHLNPGHPRQRRRTTIFEENQNGLLQPHVKTHRGVMVKPKMIFGLFQEILFNVITWNPKLYVPTEESFPIPLKYIDVTRTTNTNLDVGEILTIAGMLMEIVNCQICGLVSQDSPYLAKSTGWIYMVLVKDWQENKRPQGRTNYGQRCGNISLLHHNVKRSKSELLRNQSSTMPGDYVFFSILKTRKSSLLCKTLVESWKFWCQQHCLAKLHRAEVAGKPAAFLEDTRQITLIL